MKSLSLENLVADLKGMRAYFEERLAKLGIWTIRDLLFHFPYRYEDFSKITLIKDLEEGKTCTIQGTIEKIVTRKIWHRKMTITEAKIRDTSGILTIVWFNQTYLANSLSEGTQANFAGKIIKKGNALMLTNPLHEIIHKGETRHTARIVPVYRETHGLTSKGIRFIIQPVLENVTIPETLPEYILENEQLPGAEKALHDIHFPENLNEAFRARNRFAFEEMILLSLHMYQERKRIEARKAQTISITPENIKDLLSLIPFTLTESQKKSLWEITRDMHRAFPMHRLLQGDVGSGKTIVAGLAAILVAEKGFQVALMAPTEILARQHYETMKHFFGELQLGIALLTGNENRLFYGPELETESTKMVAEKEIKEGRIKIIIGTHALLKRKKSFSSLALVIIDEQHRFGVSQRAELLSSSKGVAPHFLSMSATPIPRTLSLILFADLDLSLITELPKNRKKIETRVIPKNDRIKAYTFIRNELKNGRQVFVICPRILPNNEGQIFNEKEIEKLEIKSVLTEYEKLSKKIFPEFSVGMLHGKMKATEKEKIMRNFSEGNLNLLVTTSVIEVGIDVPNATVMMIEDAERFGLAQLYQFKGRVGRGSHQSYCFLFTEKQDIETRTRLSYLEKAKNGFELAEYDLKTRGPGEFLGATQSGLPDLAMQALQNPQFLARAKKYAERIFEEDPKLSHYPEIRNRIGGFTEGIHRE